MKKGQIIPRKFSNWTEVMWLITPKNAAFKHKVGHKSWIKAIQIKIKIWIQLQKRNLHGVSPNKDGNLVRRFGKTKMAASIESAFDRCECGTRHTPHLISRGNNKVKAQTPMINLIKWHRAIANHTTFIILSTRIHINSSEKKTITKKLSTNNIPTWHIFVLSTVELLSKKRNGAE